MESAQSGVVELLRSVVKNGSSMWKIVGTLALMVVSGIVTYAVTAYISMVVGLQLHGNYEYYYLEYPAVFFGLPVIGLLAPAVVVWYLHKRGTRKGRWE